MARVSDARARTSFASLPSEQELAIMRNREVGVDPSVPRRTVSGRSMSYSMTEEQAIGAASLMDRSQVISPLAGLPVAASSGDFSFAKDVLGRAVGDGLWDEYWQDDQEGYGYQNLAGSSVTVGGQSYVRPGTAVTSGRGRQPAPISIVPTSTTNPERPRTVAAGYDEGRQVLTVVFRDGTFYNYYDVDRPTWEQFKAVQSKGRFIASNLDSLPRGTANMSKSPIFAREQLYRVARTGQLVNDGQTAGQFDRTLSPRINPTQSRSSRSSTNGRRRAR